MWIERGEAGEGKAARVDLGQPPRCSDEPELADGTPRPKLEGSMGIIWDEAPFAAFSELLSGIPASRADDQKCGEVIDEPVDSGRGRVLGCCLKARRCKAMDVPTGSTCDQQAARRTRTSRPVPRAAGPRYLCSCGYRYETGLRYRGGVRLHRLSGRTCQESEGLCGDSPGRPRQNDDVAVRMQVTRLGHLPGCRFWRF